MMCPGGRLSATHSDWLLVSEARRLPGENEEQPHDRGLGCYGCWSSRHVPLAAAWLMQRRLAPVARHRARGGPTQGDCQPSSLAVGSARGRRERAQRVQVVTRLRPGCGVRASSR